MYVKQIPPYNIHKDDIKVKCSHWNGHTAKSRDKKRESCYKLIYFKIDATNNEET
jgi:hypothetical protein